MRNKFQVGAVGRRVTIGNLAREPELSSEEAIELAAWLVATAVPLRKGAVGEELQHFVKLLGDAGDESFQSAVRELEEE
jgi:hypothetical protein